MVAPVAHSQPAKVENPYRVSGVVVNSVTGQRLSQVRLVMTPEGRSAPETTMTTGTDGKFWFAGLPAGKWSLYAERKGFVRQGFGQRPLPGSPVSAVVTGAGLVTEDVVFRLDPPAAIRGKVIDDSGEPVAGAALQVLMRIAGGRRRYLVLKAASTDDLGEYRIYDLPAIECYLVAVARPVDSGQALNPEAAEAGPAKIAYAPEYFPHTTDPRAASPLQLKPGEEIPADFVLKRARGVSLNIEGASGSDGLLLSAEGAQGAEVMLGMLGPGQGRAFRDIAPGRYKLTVVDTRTGTQASKRIEVGPEGATVALPFPEPAAVTAKVRVVDGDASLAQKAVILLHAEGEMQAQARMQDKDGQLTFPGMAAGRYRLFLGQVPELYVKSLTVQGAKAVNGFVDIPETGPVQLDIVASGDGGRVRGTVQANGKPLVSALVLLAPRVDSENSADYHCFQSESDGSFEYTGVQPGEYVLFATTDWQIEYGNPAAIRKYLAAGRAIHVEPKQTIEAKLEPLRP
jgi:hypothetical protein